jgi:hypothetical protein
MKRGRPRNKVQAWADETERKLGRIVEGRAALEQPHQVEYYGKVLADFQAKRPEREREDKPPPEYAARETIDGVVWEHSAKVRLNQVVWSAFDAAESYYAMRDVAAKWVRPIKPPKDKLALDKAKDELLEAARELPPAERAESLLELEERLSDLDELRAAIILKLEERRNLERLNLEDSDLLRLRNAAIGGLGRAFEMGRGTAPTEADVVGFLEQSANDNERTAVKRLCFITKSEGLALVAVARAVKMTVDTVREIVKPHKETSLIWGTVLPRRKNGRPRFGLPRRS